MPDLNNKRALTFKLGELLRVEDLASKLGISVKTVQSWIYQRKYPFTKLGRRVYFSTSVIEEILARNQVKPLSSGRNANAPHTA
jgi:excisionase family DNA binding protein